MEWHFHLLWICKFYCMQPFHLEASYMQYIISLIIYSETSQQARLPLKLRQRPLNCIHANPFITQKVVFLNPELFVLMLLLIQIDSRSCSLWQRWMCSHDLCFKTLPLIGEGELSGVWNLGIHPPIVSLGRYGRTTNRLPGPPTSVFKYSHCPVIQNQSAVGFCFQNKTSFSRTAFQGKTYTIDVDCVWTT